MHFAKNFFKISVEDKIEFCFSYSSNYRLRMKTLEVLQAENEDTRSVTG